MKRIYALAPANQPLRLLGLKPLLLYVTALIILLVSATTHRPVLSAGRHADCKTAVARVQQAVTAETYAYADARSTQCQVLSMDEDARSGKPQAINDAMQRKYLAALKETKAAYEDAGGCDTSQVKRPEISNGRDDVRRLMAICFLRSLTDKSMLQLLYGDISAPPDCFKLGERLGCNTKVVEKEKEAEPGEGTVTVPDDLKPECRDAYLDLKAAEQEYERADKREREITHGFSSGGARGRELYNRARLDLSRTLIKKGEAKRKLEACEQEGAGASVPDLMYESEGGFQGTWTRQGNTFEAVWNNGAKATLTIVQFDNDQVVIKREDTGTSVSQNFTATYTGRLSGNRIVDGKVAYEQNGRKWPGTWSAHW